MPVTLPLGEPLAAPAGKGPASLARRALDPFPSSIPDPLLSPPSPVDDRVIEETALLRSRDTKAGSLSGGQKRRLTLALELLADRRILFLDEPTSGLDATASLDLLRILKRLSRKVGWCPDGACMERARRAPPC